MKTLIIAGSVQSIRIAKKDKVTFSVKYDLALYGQTDTNPVATYITNLELECSGYDAMHDAAREKFCSYFGVDRFNITSLENLVFLPTVEITQPYYKSHKQKKSLTTK